MYFHDPNLRGARALYSAVAAHKLPGQPVWVMLIAPPGSGKSELIGSLGGLPDVHLIDSLTRNTLMSSQIQIGKKRTDASPSLLHRIGPSGIIGYSDFSTIMEMHTESRNEIMSQLRCVYDGRLRRESGAAENAETTWEGKITMVLGATPEIDRKWTIKRALGERFVQVRWDRYDLEATQKSMKQDREKMKADLRAAVVDVLANASTANPSISETQFRQLGLMADLVARARTTTRRDAYSREIEEVPEPESPTRIAQQLAQLARGSALLDARTELNTDDLLLALYVGLDSVPPLRKTILLALVRGENVYGIGGTTGVNVIAERAIEDLRLLGVLESSDKLKAQWVPLLQEAA